MQLELEDTVMFSQPHSATHRPLLVAGLASLAILAAQVPSAAAQSITPERALLNAGPTRYPVASDAERLVVDGEQALLGKSAIPLSDGGTLATQSQLESGAINGERALLGIQTQSARRPLTLAW
jgi:hypothetical protein